MRHTEDAILFKEMAFYGEKIEMPEKIEQKPYHKRNTQNANLLKELPFYKEEKEIQQEKKPKVISMGYPMENKKVNLTDNYVVHKTGKFGKQYSFVVNYSHNEDFEKWSIQQLNEYEESKLSEQVDENPEDFIDEVYDPEDDINPDAYEFDYVDDEIIDENLADFVD